MKHFTFILMLGLLLGCGKSQNAAPIERTTVGNGGNETVTAFLNQSDTLLNQIEISYEASEYARANNISIAKLRELLGGNRTAVSLVPAAQTGVRDGRLYLDESVWTAKYELGLVSQSEILEQLFKLLEISESEVKIEGLVRQLPAMEVSQSGAFAGKVQIRGYACTARQLHVTRHPDTREIELVWDFSAPPVFSRANTVATALNTSGGTQTCVVRVPIDVTWEMEDFELTLRSHSQNHAEVSSKFVVSIPGENDRIFTNEVRTTPADAKLIVNRLSDFNEASGIKPNPRSPTRYIELNLSLHALSAGTASVNPERMTLYPIPYSAPPK